MAGYKELRNIIFNDLGITKNDVADMLREECKNIARKRIDGIINSMLDNNEVEGLIKDAVTRSVSKIINVNNYHSSDIRHLTRSIITEHLLEKYDLEFKKR